MSMMPRPGLSDCAACTVVALLLTIVSGCQSPPSSHTSREIEPWHVLERVGNVRSAKTPQGLTEAVQPGDIIANGRVMSTGKGGLAILKGSGIQLTLGENTSIQLPTPAMSDIALNKGWLRVRAATAVNRTTRILTEDFDIHSASTTFLLRANPDGATLTVDSGSVVLTTRDGQHRAVLSAGASAKIDRATSDDLMIKQAFNESFKKATPLAADTPSTPPTSSTLLPSRIDSQSEPSADEATKSAIIRLASRSRAAGEPEAKRSIGPDTDDDAQVSAQTSIDPIGADIIPALSQPASSLFSNEPLDVWSPTEPMTPLSREADNGASWLNRAPELPNAEDVLQLQFDRLTEGLAEDL